MSLETFEKKLCDAFKSVYRKVSLVEFNNCFNENMAKVFS